MNKRNLIALVGVVLVICVGQVEATTIITFQDGLDRTSVGSHYNHLGLELPNWRFHDSTTPGNLPFPFVDNKGAVVDFGLGNTTSGFFNFLGSTDFLEIDAILQVSDKSGVFKAQWSLIGFDTSGNQVAVAQATVFNAGVTNTLEASTLRIDAPGLISRAELHTDSKIGVDTLKFNVTLPIPSSLLLFALGLLGILGCGGLRRIVNISGLLVFISLPLFISCDNGDIEGLPEGVTLEEYIDQRVNEELSNIAEAQQNTSPDQEDEQEPQESTPALVNGYRIQPNARLAKAELQNADLQKANLQGATLEHANLQKANLKSANLQGVNFHGANLQEANLQGANLAFTNFQWALLSGATLSEASLRGSSLAFANCAFANFKGADLQGADLQGTKLFEAVYDDKNKFPQGFNPVQKDMIKK